MIEILLASINKNYNLSLNTTLILNPQFHYYSNSIELTFFKKIGEHLTDYFLHPIPLFRSYNCENIVFNSKLTILLLGYYCFILSIFFFLFEYLIYFKILNKKHLYDSEKRNEELTKS